jgi:hypothetical protein
MVLLRALLEQYLTVVGPIRKYFWTIWEDNIQCYQLHLEVCDWPVYPSHLHCRLNVVCLQDYTCE